MTKIEESAKEYQQKEYSFGTGIGMGKLIQDAFIDGAEFMRKKAIEVQRDLCPSYKILSRYECGNYSHRHEWKTKNCNMNCEWMKKFIEKL